MPDHVRLRHGRRSSGLSSCGAALAQELLEDRRANVDLLNVAVEGNSTKSLVAEPAETKGPQEVSI